MWKKKIRNEIHLQFNYNKRMNKNNVGCYFKKLFTITGYCVIWRGYTRRHTRAHTKRNALLKQQNYCYYYFCFLLNFQNYKKWKTKQKRREKGTEWKKITLNGRDLNITNMKRIKKKQKNRPTKIISQKKRRRWTRGFLCCTIQFI